MPAVAEQPIQTRSKPPYVLFYDGSCGLCRRIVDVIGRFCTREPLRCVDVTDDSEMRRYPQIDRQKGMESVTLLEPDGRQRFGYDASTAVVALLQPLRPMSWFMRLIVIRQLGALMYKLVTKNRHRLSRWMGME